LSPAVSIEEKRINKQYTFFYLGAGFVGSHLIDRLLEFNLGRVILFDNFNDYYSPVIKQRNVALLEARYPIRVLDGSFIIIRGNINDKELLEMVFNKYKITHIAHLAVRIFVFNYIKQLINSFSISSGTCWCSFINFSNRKIYGNQLFWYTNFT